MGIDINLSKNIDKNLEKKLRELIEKLKLTIDTTMHYGGNICILVINEDIELRKFGNAFKIFYKGKEIGKIVKKPG